MVLFFLQNHMFWDSFPVFYQEFIFYVGRINRKTDKQTNLSKSIQQKDSEKCQILDIKNNLKNMSAYSKL